MSKCFCRNSYIRRCFFTKKCQCCQFCLCNTLVVWHLSTTTCNISGCDLTCYVITKVITCQSNFSFHTSCSYSGKNTFHRHIPACINTINVRELCKDRISLFSTGGFISKALFCYNFNIRIILHCITETFITLVCRSEICIIVNHCNFSFSAQSFSKNSS